MPTVAITDYTFPDLEPERSILSAGGFDLLSGIPADSPLCSLPNVIVASHIASTTHEIVQQIEKCLPAATGRITVSGPAIPANIPTAFSDIRQVLPGWEPTSLAIGIAQTIAYYRSAENNA